MQHRSEETVNRILQASGQLIARNGYDATGVAEICKAAEVSKGAFYHHFPSKQDLFLRLLNNWLETLDSQMATMMEGSPTVPEGLVRIAEIAGFVFQSTSGQLSIFLEFWREASHDPRVWQAAIGPFRRYQEMFAGIVEKGIGEGSLRPVDPTNAARLILALALGMILQGMIDPQGAAWDKATCEAMVMLLEGIKK